MCKFYSAIVMRNGDLLHNENLTSHEDLIDLFGIKDSLGCCDKFVRVEFSPENECYLPYITKYKLMVDESQTPDWFEKYRELISQNLTTIVNRRIITGSHKILTGGLYIVKDAQIDLLTQAVVIYIQNSSVNKMRENSSVNKMRENSSVNKMLENSSVNEMWGNSSVNEMLEN